MSKKVINFEEKTKNMRKPKINCFSEMVEILRYNVELLNYLGEDAGVRVQKYATLVGLESKDFLLNSSEMEDFWDSLLYEDPAELNFVSEEVDKECYHLQIRYDLENSSVSSFFSKWADGIPVALYDSMNNNWIPYTGPIFPEKFTTILNSGSPEADILELLIDNLALEEKDYQKIKQKYRKLFDLYDKTSRYMEPVCTPEKDGSVALYLIPKDEFRHGFCVGVEQNQLVLMQDFHVDEILFTNCYAANRDYRKIVGRTDNVSTMRNSLYRLANRYTENEVFTIPVSLNQYVETDNLRSLVRHSARKGAKLNDIEKKNLNSFCSFIRKNIGFENEF